MKISVLNVSRMGIKDIHLVYIRVRWGAIVIQDWRNWVTTSSLELLMLHPACITGSNQMLSPIITNIIVAIIRPRRIVRGYTGRQMTNLKVSNDANGSWSGSPDSSAGLGIFWGCLEMDSIVELRRNGRRKAVQSLIKLIVTYHQEALRSHIRME